MMGGHCGMKLNFAFSSSPTVTELGQNAASYFAGTAKFQQEAVVPGTYPLLVL